MDGYLGVGFLELGAFAGQTRMSGFGQGIAQGKTIGIDLETDDRMMLGEIGLDL